MSGWSMTKAEGKGREGLGREHDVKSHSVFIQDLYLTTIIYVHGIESVVKNRMEYT